MNVLITGANGFVGKNLHLYLRELKTSVPLEFSLLSRTHSDVDLAMKVLSADVIYHLAGINRPDKEEDFLTGNHGLTKKICQTLEKSNRRPLIIYTSSVQAELDNSYGRSKKSAEEELLRLNEDCKVPVQIFRLPNLFGKWCKPNYNSVVATFCHNIARDLPIQVTDPTKVLSLAYIDDLMEVFSQYLTDTSPVKSAWGSSIQSEKISLGDLAELLTGFRKSRASLTIARVGTGLVRKLYSTYVSYLPPQTFSYEIPSYSDSRGVFVEMLKTEDSGQFSYFTCQAGITRGEHYHHTKTEKFLIIKGEALFAFRHMITNEYFEITISGTKPQIVETIPGWAHNIANIGTEEMIVMIWANEVFDRNRPDTYAYPVKKETL